jgi:isoleucyl-tRNA synthetase
MSKKLQNYPDPMEIVNKYGADPLRFYLAQSPVVNANDLNFNEKDLSEIARGTFRMLWQSYSFFVMYANVDGWKINYKNIPKANNLLDKWLISELHQLIKEVDVEMENYHLMQATRKFAPFIDNLSNWYIRRSRKRFWKSENDGDKNEAYATLHYVLVELSKTIAPFAPYLADEIYKNLTNEESVHLVDYSVSDKALIDEEINKSMAEVREIIKVGLQLRARNQMKVRQPLSELIINNEKLDNELIEIIKEELNVKAVSVKNAQQKGHSSKRSVGNGRGATSSLRDNKNSLENIAWSEDVKIGLNLEITSELKAEGQARELIRAIQQMRKEADYQLDDRIKIGYSGLKNVFSKFGDLIAKETLADTITAKELPASDLEKKITIDNNKTTLWIKK